MRASPFTWTIQYVFHEDTETCTVVYSRYCEDYELFYHDAVADGFLLANVFRLLQREIEDFCQR